MPQNMEAASSRYWLVELNAGRATVLLLLLSHLDCWLWQWPPLQQQLAGALLCWPAWRHSQRHTGA
jgi:hypothetical protein